jgi:alpha-glucosidase
MNRNDQEMVAFYHRVLAAAARHHLMVDLHGAYPPDGLARTYPNFVTQEGVMGAEYNKWSARVTATHNVTLPFTRMLLGPIDYTPGGFRATTPAGFAAKMRDKKPYVQTTRGQALAMYVVYDSPVAMVADSPDAYVNPDGSLAAGVDFLERVPTSWDETRVLNGEMGQYIVTARRKGNTWYVGAMTNEAGRKLTVPLDFLGAGRSYMAEVYEDGTGPNDLRKRSAQLRKGSKLTLTLAGSGGAAVVVEPAGK